MKLAKIKKNVKHYLPEIIVGTTTAAAFAAYGIWALKSAKDSGPELALFFSAEDLTTIIDEDTPMTFMTEFGKLRVFHV